MRSQNLIFWNEVEEFEVNIGKKGRGVRVFKA